MRATPGKIFTTENTELTEKEIAETNSSFFCVLYGNKFLKLSD